MNSKVQALLKGVKWTTLAALALSGWLAAAWIKSDINQAITPVQIERTLEIHPLPTKKGEVAVTLPCVPVRVQIPKQQAADTDHISSEYIDMLAQQRPNPYPSGELSPVSGGQSPLQLQPNTPGSQSPVVPGFVYPLNLGSYVVLPSKEKRTYDALLHEDGGLTLKLKEAGGRWRFGGERYVSAWFGILSNSDKEVGVSVYQNMFRLFKTEVGIEAYVQQRIGATTDLEYGLRAKLRWDI